MLLNFPSFMKTNVSENEYSLLEELREIQFWKSKGGPPFSADVIRYTVHLRYTSLEAYKLLLNKFLLSSK